MGKFRKTSYTPNEFFKDRHRFEHWYRDNSVYFITSEVRDGFRAFATADAKRIFWDRFDYSKRFPTRGMSAKRNVVTRGDHAT